MSQSLLIKHAQDTMLCPGRGAFVNIAEAKSKGCFAIINKQFVDFVCSKQAEIGQYNSQKKAKADVPDALQQRMDSIKDRISKTVRIPEKFL